MKRFSQLALCLIVGIIVSACGLGGNTQEPAGDNRVVTIGFAANEHERQFYEPLVETFNTENPDINVQLVSIDEIIDPRSNEPIPSDQRMRQILSAADTFATSYLEPTAIERGYLLDLAPLMDADADFNRDDFYPRALAGAGVAGATYMLPTTVRIELLSYNQDLWAANNLPAPAPDWTWSDMIATAEELAAKRGDTVDVYGLLLDGGGIGPLFGELNAAGIDLFATPVEQVRLDQPEILAAAERVLALGDSGALYLSTPDNEEALADYEDVSQLILDQRFGMWPETWLYFGPDQRQPNFTVGTVPFPTISPFFSSNNTEGYVISSGTQHQQAAWRWITFLSNHPPNDTFRNPDDISTVPARRSQAEEQGYWADLDDETTAAIEFMLNQSIDSNIDSTIFTQNVSVMSPLYEAFEAILQGDPVDQALIEAQASLEEQIAEVALTPEPTPDTSPLVVATPAVVAAPEGATTISFLPSDPSIIRAIVREFNQNNTEIFVEIFEPPAFDADMTEEDYQAREEAMMASIDCLHGYGLLEPDMIIQTLDLQPLIDADASFDIHDYPEAFLAPYRNGSGLHGLPYAVSFHTLHYNQTAFDTAGLAYPTIDWTMDDFLNAAQQLSVGSGDEAQYGYAVPGSFHIQDIEFFLNRSDAALTEGSAEATRPTFTEPNVVAALRYYLDLLQNYSPHESIEGYSAERSRSDDPSQLIFDGRLGMWFDFSFGFSTGGEQDFVLAVAPLPLGDTPLTSNDVQFQGLHISAQSQHPEACWTWIKHLSGETALLRHGDFFPARLSVADSAEFQAQTRVGAAEVFAAYRTALERAPVSETQSALFGSDIDFYWFFGAVDNALQGADLEQELAEAQATTEQYLDCLRAGAEGYECALRVDPDYNGWQQPPQEDEEQ